jgi:hypothetical protein
VARITNRLAAWLAKKSASAGGKLSELIDSEDVLVLIRELISNAAKESLNEAFKK